MPDVVSQFVDLNVSDGTVMRAWTARPAGKAPTRGLLVFQEAFGVNGHIRDVTERFARQGFAAVSPELYHRSEAGFEAGYEEFPKVMPLMSALTREGLLADIQAAAGWLRNEGGIAADRLAATGCCLGGAVSYLANAVLPLRAAVSYYGGRTADSLDLAGSLSGPMLFFWGELDSHIPPERVRAVLEALKEKDKSFANISFSDAGHGFFCDARAAYHAESARQAWEWTLSFLDRHLP